jgi:hypothetical protein
MFGLAKIKIYLIAAGLATAALLTIAGLIYRAGQTSTETDTLKDTVKAHETSDRISTEVDQMGRVARCLELSGLPERCDELRGLDKASQGQ